MFRHWRLALGASLALGAAVPGFAAADDAADTATLYLRAWSFKDYPAMRDLSASKPDEARYFGAAARLPVPSGEAKILSRTARPGGGGETVYFEYPAAGAAEKARGSIVVTRDGVLHPELLAAAESASAAPAGLADASSPGSVDGETAESIVKKMQDASVKVLTLQGPVVISGSMMGTTVNETARLTYKAPDKIRLDSKSFVMNADGKRSLLYMPEANIYLDLAGMGDLELTPGIGLSPEEMREKYEVELAGKSEVAGQPAYKLLLKSPVQSAGLPLGFGQGSGRMTLWVSPKTWLPLRASVDGIKVEYDKLQANASEVDDAAFDFQPPKGATAFSLGGLMGALTGGGSGLPE